MNEQQLLIMIGGKIREIREKKMLTLQELADKCDFEKSNMSRIEYGRTNMTIKTLYKISCALNVPLIDFFKIDTDYKKLKD